MTLRLRIYEFLATPGHAWLWLIARLCGLSFEWGAVHGEDEELNGD